METGQRQRGGEKYSPLVCQNPVEIIDGKEVGGCTNPIPPLGPLDRMALELFAKCKGQYELAVGFGAAIKYRFIQSDFDVFAKRYGFVVSPAISRRLEVLVQLALADDGGDTPPPDGAGDGDRDSVN